MKKRERSAVLTTISSGYYTLIACVMPFMIRTTMIKYIGIEYLGIKGLFESVIQVLNIVNLGAESSFFSYFLFKPCELHDHDTINAIMRLIRAIYICICFITLVIGLGIMPFLPALVINRTYPSDLNFYLIFFIYVICNSFSYLTNYLFILYSPMLMSHIHIFAYGTSFFLMYSLQLITLVCFHDYLLYTSLLLPFPLFLFCFFTISNKIYFPWLNYKGHLSSKFIKKFRVRLIPMFISKIRNVSRNSLDSVIISYFLGLEILARYQNYYQILLVPLMIVQILSSAIRPALGNGISAESTESNYGILKQFTIVQNFASTICVTCLISLIQPFMKLWVGSEYLLGMDIVICVGVYFYALSVSDIVVVLRDTTGTWDKGKWVAIAESALNLILNIVFMKLMGLYGVILASIITVTFINIPLELRYVFKYYFKANYKEYMCMLVKNTVLTAIIAVISHIICEQITITDYLMAVIRLILAIIIPTVLYIILHLTDKEFMDSLKFFKRIFNLHS